MFSRALSTQSAEKAIILLDKAASKNPHNANIFALRAIKHASIGEFSKAEEDCNRAIQIDPDNIFQFKARALIEIHEENYQEAIDFLRIFVKQVVLLYNDWQKTGVKIGSIRISTKKKYFRKNDLAHAYYLAAICYMNVDDYETTLYCLERADENNPDENLELQVKTLRREINQLKHEEKKKLEATPGYKIRNCIRILIAFPGWIFIYLTKHSIYVVILGILSVPLSIAVQTSANMSYEGIHYGKGDPQSASGIILVIGVICLFYGLYMLQYKSRHESFLGCFPIPLFENICQRITGLSIFEVISSDGERFL